MNDLRNTLPTNGEAQYGTRQLSDLTGITLHYTAGPASQTAHAVATYQTSEAARHQTGNNTPFPGIAYTILVVEDGTPCLCHDLTVRTWHSAASVNCIPQNQSNIGICYTGNVEPNANQIRGLAEAIAWCEGQVGRHLDIAGHRDAPYATACPGPVWPSWRAKLQAALGGGVHMQASLEQLAQANPNLPQHLADWQHDRRSNGENPWDWDAFRAHAIALGDPDYGAQEFSGFCPADVLTLRYANPGLGAQLAEWQLARFHNGEAHNDYEAFRTHMFGIHCPDPGDGEFNGFQVALP